MFKILVVEDDAVISSLTIDYLRKWQFEAQAITDFDNVLSEFLAFKPDLVLLDINLPIYDGYYWCQKIRDISKVPIIFVSSRNSNMDLVMAMNMGGDDFVDKPFSFEVLIAKINALLRRTYDYTLENSQVIEHNGLLLNLENNTVFVDDQSITLSKNEYQLLYLLMKNSGKILSREKLLRALWDDTRFVDDNTLTVNITRLRKKLQAAGLENFIETKVGQGYVIN
ncbi:MAG: response regulator transcription factor [Streptococcaceae bacterium]|jgi:two-component system OmpR family response regulator|nr:response regulator transcription factor [Streptococcaceae bacterium]